MLISLYIEKHKYVTGSFKIPTPIGHNVSEKICVSLHSKYLYYLKYFFQKHVFIIIELYLAQYKYVKIRYKNFPSLGRNLKEEFKCPCRRTIRPIHIIFNTVHSILYINNLEIYWNFKNIYKS